MGGWPWPYSGSMASVALTTLPQRLQHCEALAGGCLLANSASFKGTLLIPAALCAVLHSLSMQRLRLSAHCPFLRWAKPHFHEKSAKTPHGRAAISQHALPDSFPGQPCSFKGPAYAGGESDGSVSRSGLSTTRWIETFKHALKRIMQHTDTYPWL